MVLHSSHHWLDHGIGWLYQPDAFLTEESLRRAILCHTVLLHRRCSSHVQRKRSDNRPKALLIDNFMQAAIYTLITIAINRVGRQFAPIPPKVILWVFIACDVLATIIQVAGAAMIGVAYSNGKDPTTPNNILLAGLSFQVFSFFLFIIVFVAFLWRSRNATTRDFKTFAAATGVATLAVYLRTIFRLAETAEGLMETLSTHEVYFGCLEFLPIVVAVYVFIWWHPGKWLGSKRQHGKAFDGMVLDEINLQKE